MLMKAVEIMVASASVESMVALRGRAVGVCLLCAKSRASRKRALTCTCRSYWAFEHSGLNFDQIM